MTDLLARWIWLLYHHHDKTVAVASGTYSPTVKPQLHAVNALATANDHAARRRQADQDKSA